MFELLNLLSVNIYLLLLACDICLQAAFKLDRHHSMSQSLTKTVLSGSALERKSRGISRQDDREFSHHDGLVDMYIEDILHTGEKM